MKITIDKNAKTTPTDFSWQFGIGNDHAFQLHRKDVCAHVKTVHDELGMRYIRFHGIFDDDMLCIQRLSDYKPFGNIPCSNRVTETNFNQIADVFNNVLACGMKPFVELSFMPGALASGKKTGIRYQNNITQPISLEAWAAFIKKFILFLKDYYGEAEIRHWYFEVWHEPDLSIFFKGSQSDYLRFYAATAKAVKSVDAQLQIGGPSSSACLWIDDFVNYCRKNSVPFDFISTHHYPGDAFGNSFSMRDAFKMMSIVKSAAKSGKALSDVMQEMFFKPNIYKKWDKGILARMDEKAAAKAGDKPLFITEWNSMAVFASPAHDEKYAAAFIVKSCMDLKNRIKGYMFWCCSDIYEEQFMLGRPFHGGFGLINNCGIPKPNFYAFKLLSRLYPQRLDLSYKSSGDVECAAFTDGEKLQILVYSQSMDYTKNDETKIQLEINFAAKAVMAQYIDDAHCNPKKEWLQMGAPDILRPAQITEIQSRTSLTKESIPFTAEHGHTQIALTLRTNDIVLLSLS